MKTYIHVNQHKIKANLKNNTDEPVITVKQGKKNTYCHSVKILGDSVVRYSETGKPVLSCGARVVIETQAEVITECRPENAGNVPALKQGNNNEQKKSIPALRP